jgi:chromosome segregation ATPase
MAEDLTHSEILDAVRQQIDRVSKEVAGSNVLLAAQIKALGERHQGAVERLEAGGARFSRLETLIEQSAADRAELRKELVAAMKRLTALEAAKAIVDGVDGRISQRALAWRRRFWAVLVFLFGNGTAFTLFVLYTERFPPGQP